MRKSTKAWHVVLRPALAAAAIAATAAMSAEVPVSYQAELTVNAGGGEFTPYYMTANKHGVLTQSKNALLRASAWKETERDKRFSYGFGIDLVGGWGSSVDYLHSNTVAKGESNTVGTPGRAPSRFWIQQLYGEVKYRGVFLTAGLKQHGSALLNQRLSSGDLVESGNSRPIPEVRVGFIDFQDIPFTRGWLQIQGEVAYGKLTDNHWQREHYNYLGYHLNQGALYTYKRCYFRTNPQQPLSATFGMQLAGMFGGETKWYRNGVLIQQRKFSKGVKQFFKMFLPTESGTSFYTGSTLGSWDVMFRYRLPNDYDLKAYFQKPFEDGSGIGFLNGWDGVWGLELNTNSRGPVSGVVVEYLDFTNQSGPMHWDPDDTPGAGIKGRAEGADDYYNNHEFNSYAYYGMAIGTPFMVSPIYNTDGWPAFLYNRMRGFHVGVEGEIVPGVDYRVLGGCRRSWGTGYIPLIEPKSDTSVMAEVTWQPEKVKGLSLKVQAGLDHGKLMGDNAGGCLTVRYTCDFKL